MAPDSPPLGRWGGPGNADPRETLLEAADEAPVIAFVMAGPSRVVWANRPARDAFRIDRNRLPAGLLEVTREVRLEEAIRGRNQGADIRLVHHPMTVRLNLPDPLPDGRQLVFLTDVTLLRRLETVRQEFVSNLSHELRTPLTSMRISIESLTADLPAADARRFALRALKDADHVIAMVENLRQLADIEGGSLALQRSRFRLVDVVEEIAARLQIGERTRVTVPDEVVLESDRSKLSQALTNLLENAAKFSPTGSPVEVGAEARGAEVLITVRDWGPGLSPEHWDRVFERFYKVDQARSRDSGGSGLGLAITKHLVIALKGRIWTRAAIDGGQVFAILLPLRISGP